MTEEEQTALLIKGMVASLPEEQRLKVEACVREIQAVVDNYGDLGRMAIAVIGSQAAVDS